MPRAGRTFRKGKGIIQLTTQDRKIKFFWKRIRAPIFRHQQMTEKLIRYGTPSTWTHKRVQEGGWTNQVNSYQLPSSQDIAGVRMRLTAGSFRELHWHASDEWAYMSQERRGPLFLNWMVR